jgi:integrase
LGVYPKVGLAKARLLHADSRGLLARGIDSSAERRRLRAANGHTFESVARSWLKVLQVRVHKHTLTATTVEKNLRLLERYIFPRIGRRPIAAITFKGRPITGIALKLAPLLFVRPGELRHARWRHINFASAQWRIPAECMKSRVQHLVPLSKQALALLKSKRLGITH